MFERIIRFAIDQRWLVLLAVLAMAALGLHSYQRLSIDAVPDITNVQVQINTGAPGYSPLETEQRVTFPIETVMAGLPGLLQTRSLSRYGLSQVTVVFRDGTDVYFARQLVNERLQSARAGLPAGVEPMIAASLLVLGLLVATRLRLAAPAAALLVGAFAVFHGIAHGHELAGQPDAAATLAGMLVATVALHAAGIACGWALRHRSRWLPRLAGAAVALFGVALLAGVA